MSAYRESCDVCMRRKSEDEAKAAESAVKPKKKPLPKHVLQLRLGITSIAGSLLTGTIAVGVGGGLDGLKVLAIGFGGVMILLTLVFGIVMLISWSVDRPK